MRRARDRKARRLRLDLAAADRARRIRYGAVTAPEPAKRLDTMTAAEADQVLAEDKLKISRTAAYDSAALDFSIVRHRNRILPGTRSAALPWSIANSTT